MKIKLFISELKAVERFREKNDPGKSGRKEHSIGFRQDWMICEGYEFTVYELAADELFRGGSHFGCEFHPGSSCQQNAEKDVSGVVVDCFAAAFTAVFGAFPMECVLDYSAEYSGGDSG